MRQSAFALMGDLARTCPAYLTPILTQLVALSLANLETSAISHGTLSACNNACWSLGALLGAPAIDINGATGIQRARGWMVDWASVWLLWCVPDPLCDAAARCAGELAMQQRGESLAPLATTIVEHLIPILQSPMGTVPRSLTENCAITLGRVRYPPRPVFNPVAVP